MSYYNSGYGGGNNQNQQGQQQQGSSNDGFYSNTSSAVPPPQAAFAGNTQQWTAPQQAQQTQQQQTQQQPAFWNPAAAATMIGSVAAATGSGNDAMLDLASSAGKTFLQSGSARMIPGLEMFMTKLRTYFAVDNYYVKRKMLKIVLPYTSKHWKREVRLVFCCCDVWYIYTLFFSLTHLFIHTIHTTILYIQAISI